MLTERRWIAAFAHTLSLCGVAPGDEVAVLSETQSRPVLPRLAEHPSSAWGRGPSTSSCPRHP